jgi:exonuclease VII small subunit
MECSKEEIARRLNFTEALLESVEEILEEANKVYNLNVDLNDDCKYDYRLIRYKILNLLKRDEDKLDEDIEN